MAPVNGPARDKIGDYEILESIGQGSRGRVFKARCVATNNPRVAKDRKDPEYRREQERKQAEVIAAVKACGHLASEDCGCH